MFKKTISQRVKGGSGTIHAQGTISATCFDLDRYMKTLPQPWTAAMEATVFTGWIYDHLQPHAAALKVAHPLMLRAIAAAKEKNDRIDANKICDCLRCDFLPECYMAPTAIRERRRTLRYRNLLVRQMAQMKNKISWLLDGNRRELQQAAAARVFRTMLLILVSVSTKRSERHNFTTISLRQTSCAGRPTKKISNSMGFFSSFTRRPSRRGSYRPRSSSISPVLGRFRITLCNALSTKNQ
jgi:hypothetical protein